MTRHLVARSIVALALLVPIAASAQTFIQKTKPSVASNLSLTLNPTGAAPARLKYASGERTFDAQAETVKVTYAAAGLTVEMSVGSYTGTDYKEPIQMKSADTFKSLYLTFATNGDLTNIRVSKD
jgi:hypothetical protein